LGVLPSALGAGPEFETDDFAGLGLQDSRVEERAWGGQVDIEPVDRAGSLAIRELGVKAKRLDLFDTALGAGCIVEYTEGQRIRGIRTRQDVGVRDASL